MFYPSNHKVFVRRDVLFFESADDAGASQISSERGASAMYFLST
jgi:hypothetical protein